MLFSSVIVIGKVWHFQNRVFAFLQRFSETINSTVILICTIKYMEKPEAGYLSTKTGNMKENLLTITSEAAFLLSCLFESEYSEETFVLLHHMF